jgi:hypothetical protein
MDLQRSPPATACEQYTSSFFRQYFFVCPGPQKRPGRTAEKAGHDPLAAAVKPVQQGVLFRLTEADDTITINAS